jgi:hypothetical protein
MIFHSRWLCSLVVLLCSAPLLATPKAQAVDAATTLKDTKKQLKSKDVDERKKALQTIAAIKEPDLSKDVAKALAGGLKDKSFAVREIAAKLLRNQQNPEVALSSLTAAATDLQKILSKKGRSDWGLLYQPSKDEDEKTKKAKEELRDLLAYGVEVIKSLTTFRDDRTVKSLLDLKKKLSEDTPYDIRYNVMDGLVRLGTRAGIAAVIADFPALQQSGSADGARVHRMLTKLAFELELSGTPDRWGEDAPDLWKKWFSKNQKAFPSKIGKLKS